MNKLTKLTYALVLSICLAAAPAMAQTTSADPTIPGHPRVNEVDQRLQNQQNRVDTGVANGQIGAKAEAHDDARDTKVSQELSADQAKNGGHITKAEQSKMNRQLNHNSAKIHKQRTKATTTTAPATTPAQ